MTRCIQYSHDGRRPAVWFVFLAVLSLPFALRAETVLLTLENCLALGKERSIALANSERERRIADQNIRGIRAQVFPSLDAEGRYSRLEESILYPGYDPVDSRNQYSAAVTAEQLLYSGGSVRAALNAAKSYRMQAEDEVARVDAQSQRDITKAFFDALYREAAVDVARESVEQLAAFEREAKLKFESGAISEFEWLSAQVNLANERPALVVAENERDISRSVLRNLLYLDDDNWTLVHKWKTETPVFDLAVLQENGQTNRWELRQARVNLDVLEADIKVTEAEYLPEITAFASYLGADPPEYNPFDEGWDWQWIAGVRATWNLLDGGARSATRIEKLLAREIASDNIIDLERRVNLEIETSFRNLTQSLRILDGARETIALAEKSFAISQLRFERGLATNLEFTDRNLALNRARIQQLRGLLAYYTALADLRYASGTDLTLLPRKTP